MLKVEKDAGDKRLTFHCQHETMLGIVKQLGLHVENIDGTTIVDADQEYCGFYEESDQLCIIRIYENSDAEFKFNAVGGTEWIDRILKN